MERLRITPTKLSGDIVVPPSKSMAHRAIICASLADGKSRITNVSYSDDIRATIDCMRLLGADIQEVGDTLEICGSSRKICKDITFDCKESGSTLRFILPIALALNSGENRFIGRGKLGSRPLEVYEEICKERNIEYVNEKGEDGRLDLRVKGKLSGGEFKVDGAVSSQFVTGLLYALPLLEDGGKITVVGKLQSSGYVDLTASAMSRFGVEVVCKKYKEFYIEGNGKFHPCDYNVEGDWSQAAFFEVARFLGNDVRVKGVDKDSLQGDCVILEFLDRLTTACDGESLVFDGSDCPDIIPVFALACCLRRGETNIVNISRLRIKECDRLEATATELAKLGADINADGDSLIIRGKKYLVGGEVSSRNDHRMAMTLAIASTAARGEVALDDWQCVSKSYPDFFDVFERSGGKISKG